MVNCVFDGTGDYVNCGTDSSLDINSSFTASAWVKTSDAADTYQGILLKAEGNTPETAGNQGWELIYRSNSSGFRFYVRDANDNYINVQSLPAGSITDWHFVVGVYDDANNTTRLYIDGEKKASSSSANFGDIKASGNSLRIGMYGGSHFFNGKIDEWEIWGHHTYLI